MKIRYNLYKRVLPQENALYKLRKDIMIMFFTTDSNGKKVLDIKKYEKIGFRFNKDGVFTGINENLYAAYLVTVFALAIRYDSVIYRYINNVWRVVTMFHVKRALRKHFNKLLPNAWTAGYEGKYMSAYLLEMPSVEDFIPGHEYINLENGLFSLGEKWMLKKHSSKIFTTTRIPLSFNLNDPGCPVFMSFLEDIFNKDREIIDLVQELLGYCLTRTITAHKIFLFMGTGRNGKGLLQKVIEALVGKENTSHISLAGFKKDFKVAQIVDKQVNIAGESSVKDLDTDTLKSISGGDEIQIEPKFEKPFNYQPFVKLIFSVNKLPNTTDISTGFLERLVIVPFGKRYIARPNPKVKSEFKDDIYLVSKLLADLPGIFTFALKGLRRLQRNNYTFTEPAKVTEMLEEYRAMINPYIDFIETRIHIDLNAKVSRTDVYEAFKDFAFNQGFKTYVNISARVFYHDFEEALTKQGVEHDKKKSNDKRYITGMRLKSQREIQAPSVTVIPKKTRSINNDDTNKILQLGE